MRIWRSHPVLFAALVGAAVGLANAIAIEVGGALGRNSNAVLLMLLPRYPFGLNPTGLAQSLLILFIEVAVNVLVYALMFSVPVALIVGLRRAFAGRRS
jgi:hypothetical protein